METKRTRESFYYAVGEQNLEILLNLDEFLGYPLDVHLTHPFLRENFTIVMCRIKLWVHATARGTRGKK